MMDRDFAFTRTLPGVPYDEARRRIEASLAEAGFGIITEIDVKATFKKKIDKEFRNYAILGACSPSTAYEVLGIDPAIGLLLPCNVVVTETDDGDAVVSVADPKAMLATAGNRPELEGPMATVRTNLRKALDAL